MQNALNDVAGTGTERHRFFLAQVDTFHREWRAHFLPLIFAKRAITSLDANPRFAYREESTSAVAGRVVTGLAGLVVPSLVLAWVGLMWMRRYPVA